MRKVVPFLLLMFMVAIPAGVSAQQSSAGFADTGGHWAEKSIIEVSSRQLMNGTGTNEQGSNVFSPDSAVSRAQLATVLHNTFQFEYGPEEVAEPPLARDYYGDVDNEAWYAKGLVMCALNKIFSTGGDFLPQRQVSRLEVAQAVHRSFNAKDISVPMIMMMPFYGDTQSPSQEDTNAVTFVSNTGIMRGDNNYFRPADNMSRAELAVLLVKCADLIKNNQSPAAIHNRVIKKDSEYMSTELNIPVISGLTDDALQTSLNTRWENDALNLEKELAAQIDAYVEYNKENDFPIRAYQLTTAYQEGLLNDSLVSLYVDYYQFTGGAHGITNREPYNIDLTTGNELALQDLFQPDYDYRAVINQEINQQIAADPEAYFTGDMGFKGITEQQSYYLQEGYLVVYFQQYEIAPYASGIREFKMLLTDFQEGLREGLLE